MKLTMFRCVCCGRTLPCDPRAINQHYCGRKKCQQARKNKWQRQKLANDPDYRADKRDSQRTWRERNKGYSRKYRSNHPDYVLRNRQKQKERDKRRCQPSSPPQIPVETMNFNLAKKDVLSAILNDNPVSYFISPADASLVKKDALMVKIFPVSTR